MSKTKGFPVNKSLSWFFLGTVVGSVFTYFLDPKRGNTRRDQFKSRSLKLKRESKDMAARIVRIMTNKSKGMKAKALHAASKKNEPVSDQVLEARIRSGFGRIVSHSKSVKVSVQNGVVTLTGPILSNEVKDTIRCVTKIPGVKEVVNKLDAHDTSENIPELQGRGPAYLH